MSLPLSSSVHILFCIILARVCVLHFGSAPLPLCVFCFKLWKRELQLVECG